MTSPCEVIAEEMLRGQVVRLVVLAILGCTALACNPFSTPTPTPTDDPATPTPTSTPTPTPTPPALTIHNVQYFRYRDGEAVIMGHYAIPANRALDEFTLQVVAGDSSRTVPLHGELDARDGRTTGIFAASFTPYETAAAQWQYNGKWDNDRHPIYQYIVGDETHTTPGGGYEYDHRDKGYALRLLLAGLEGSWGVPLLHTNNRYLTPAGREYLTQVFPEWGWYIHDDLSPKPPIVTQVWQRIQSVNAALATGLGGGGVVGLVLIARLLRRLR